MNIKGQVFMMTLMLGLVVLLLAVALAGPLSERITAVRNTTYDSGTSTGMDCANVSISNYQKAACTATDVTIFYFIGAMIFIAGAIIVAKVAF